ncbi:MAG: hypothetical protein JRI33_02765 [Deltaproteobacteria bacterium]|nr:hypothetical protein [Deltaproteobacteria bacterium]
MSFETRKKVTASRQDTTGSPNIYKCNILLKAHDIHDSTEKKRRGDTGIEE